jgi:hypothetical protein
VDTQTGLPSFDDVTLETGLATARPKGLGAVCRDFNGDRLPDIFVANDQQANALWIQQPGGTFREEASLRGVACNALGEVEANMGVVCDDLNNDDAVDLFLTHLRGETNTLFLGDGAGQFLDRTPSSGLGPPSLTFTGFGTVAADLEHDGDLDLLVVNGRVMRDPFRQVFSSKAEADWRDYAETNQVFLNDGQGGFTELITPFSEPVEVSRGLATGDVDSDGDLDFLLTNAAGQARLYRNDFPKSGHWLSVRAIDPALNRDALGAVVILIAGEQTFNRELACGSSYLSCHELSVHFGLGSLDRVDAIEVLWPSGTPIRERFPVESVDQSITVLHGHGTVAVEEVWE